ncbi:MAG: hypothetical protein NZO58_02030, partial [Gemmataceae bacterium]|nr:hypothetical protein [Gemmataceae bacterium]
AYGPEVVLRVRNLSAANQRATVQVMSTGLVLTRVVAGASATDTVAFADNATLADVARAIQALGHGWSAALAAAEFAELASADLRALQGAFPARDQPAELRLHLHEAEDYLSDPARGWLIRPGGWPGGPQAWRIVYTAGFAAVPDDVQEACAQWVAQLFWQTKRDPGLAQETVPGSIAREPLRVVPVGVQTLLAPYRAYRA